MNDKERLHDLICALGEATAKAIDEANEMMIKRIQDETRKSTLKEVGEWLENNEQAFSNLRMWRRFKEALKQGVMPE